MKITFGIGCTEYPASCWVLSLMTLPSRSEASYIARETQVGLISMKELFAIEQAKHSLGSVCFFLTEENSV